MLQNPDHENKRIFWQPLCTLFYFNLTRAPGSFLVTSALNADDQPWTFKWPLVQCKTCPFIYNMEKSSIVRIHLLSRYLCITCCTLLNNIGTWARESLMMIRRQMSKEMTQVHQNLRRAISTFLQACSMQSLLHQGITELFKSLIFQIGSQNSHRINKRCSIN